MAKKRETLGKSLTLNNTGGESHKSSLWVSDQEGKEAVSMRDWRETAEADQPAGLKKNKSDQRAD